MLAAKIVPNLLCGCGHQFKSFVRAEDGWVCKCPACGKDVNESDRSSGKTRFYGNRRFAASESISRCQGFHPEEVPEARKRLDKYQHCIRDDGRVVFSDRKEERAYVKALHSLEDRMANGTHNL